MSTTIQSTTPTPPMKFPSHGTLVYPGDKVGMYTETAILSTGVHRIDDYIYSSVLGALSKDEQSTRNNNDDSDVDDSMNDNTTTTTTTTTEKKQITTTKDSTITPLNTTTTYSVLSLTPQPSLPRIGDNVICRVTEIQTRQVFVELLFSEKQGEAISECRGVIRSRDIRALDTDGVVTYDSYRPGDIVKAMIISFGDVRSYYLSTAKINLGVIYAENIEGVGMTLLPPKDEFKSTSLVHYMKCPLTGVVQPRKAALVE